MFSVKLDRTDLRISLSRAKFDARTDFDVRSAVEPRKPRQIGKKQIFRSKNFVEQFFGGVEKRNVRNRLKRVFAKFRSDASQVQHENCRSKFVRCPPMLMVICQSDFMNELISRGHIFKR